MNVSVFVTHTSPPSVLVNPTFIKAVCILLVILPVSSLRNISSLEKVTAGYEGIPNVMLTLLASISSQVLLCS